MNRVRALLQHGTTSRRVVCCLAVSCSTTILSAVILVVLVVGLDVRAGLANIIAVCCGILPSYEANRRWTWTRTGRRDLAREVAPFWVLSIAGLLASTATVAAAAALTTSWPPEARSIALPMVQAGTFAVLWVVQFVVLDRVIFRPTATSRSDEHELVA